MRRMDRYNAETNSGQKRAEKNQELYQNIASNTRYTNITDVTNSNAFEINNKNSLKSSRESYQQRKKYQTLTQTPRTKKELDDFNYLYKNHENKVYDINSVLEEARKNREEKDALDEKRKLKNTSYNILAGLNIEELEKYRKEKEKRLTEPDEHELRDLIDTIASKTLSGEISKDTGVDLLSDLMATNVLDKVAASNELPESEKELKLDSDEESEEKIDEKLSLSKEILDQEQLKKLEKEEKNDNISKLKNADTDFYTRSMDLSDKDFDFGDDFKEKKLPLPIKIIITILIIAVIAIAAYFIYQRF